MTNRLPFPLGSKSFSPAGEHLEDQVGYRHFVWLESVKRHFKSVNELDTADPVEAIKFQMDQKGLTVKDLEPMIGRSNRVYEVLNRTRPLPLAMIWRLHQGLGIPAEALIQPPKRTVVFYSPNADTSDPFLKYIINLGEGPLR